jgi:hypothetical protein
MDSIPETSARATLAAANKKGVTYSRSITGTGMPSKERFQTRPMGRAFKRCLLSRNFLFRYRQQPKLRKLDVVFFLVVVFS